MARWWTRDDAGEHAFTSIRSLCRAWRWQVTWRPIETPTQPCPECAAVVAQMEPEPSAIAPG